MFNLGLSLLVLLVLGLLFRTKPEREIFPMELFEDPSASSESLRNFIENEQKRNLWQRRSIYLSQEGFDSYTADLQARKDVGYWK